MKPVTEQYTGFDRTASHNAGEYREFQQPPDAERLAEIVDEIAERFITGKVIEAGYKLHELAAALRAKDKP